MRFIPDISFSGIRLIALPGTLQPFFGENGSIIDLNAGIPANSSLFLVEPDNINERGEIVGRGLPPGCDDVDACGHVFLLVPCSAGKGRECEATSSPTAPPLARTVKGHHAGKEFVKSLRARSGQHKRLFSMSWNYMFK